MADPPARLNATLLDPNKWGWTAGAGVADVLTPHEVRSVIEERCARWALWLAAILFGFVVCGLWLWASLDGPLTVHSFLCLLCASLFTWLVNPFLFVVIFCSICATIACPTTLYTKAIFAVQTKAEFRANAGGRRIFFEKGSPGPIHGRNQCANYCFHYSHRTIYIRCLFYYRYESTRSYGGCGHCDK